jgi:hypothetical protein
MSCAAASNGIENRTSSELKVGDSPSIARTLTSQDIELVNAACGTKQEFCGRNAHYGTHH